MNIYAIVQDLFFWTMSYVVRMENAESFARLRFAEYKNNNASANTFDAASMVFGILIDQE